jgi:hypothetical protein
MAMKKVRCYDGKVRYFQTSTKVRYQSGIVAGQFTGAVSDTKCLECGYNFGVHSWMAIVEELRRHVCKKV